MIHESEERLLLPTDMAVEGALACTDELNQIRPTVEQIHKVLRGVGAGLLRWPNGKGRHQHEWRVCNEYDVQSLLYCLLRPYVPEIKEEEPLPSIGTKRPRVDIAIPSLRLLIEVKFLRATESFNKVLGEVAEDKSFYLGKGSSYDRMLVFLWDDSQRTEEHASFERGILDLELNGAVVISRPSILSSCK